jgi:hypothetical protein
MATKKPMKFKGGGKIKRYYAGEVVTGDDSSPYSDEGAQNVYVRNGAIDRDTIARNTAAMRRAVMNGDEGAVSRPDYQSDVLNRITGKTPVPENQFTQLPPRKRTFQDDINDNVAKALKTGKPPTSGSRDAATKGSESQPTADNSIPPASTSSYKAPVAEEKSALRKNFPGMASIYDYYASPTTAQGVKDNLANSAMALTPLTGGATKVATEFAMGNRGAKLAQAMQGEEKLSAAGQRLKNLEELRGVANPGRAEAVMNPNAWAAGPKGMDKIAQVEGRAAEAEARAAQAAARKKAAQAKKDAKDPVMNARPGADNAAKVNTAKTPKTGKASLPKYETDEPLDISFGYKRGGAVKKFAKGGSVSSASSRGDGIAIRGKTKGTISKMCGGGMMKGRK